MFEGPFMWLRSVAEVGLSARTHNRGGTARTLAGSVREDEINYTLIAECAYSPPKRSRQRILDASPLS